MQQRFLSSIFVAVVVIFCCHTLPAQTKTKISVYFENKSNKMVYLALAYIPLDAVQTSDGFVDKQWFKLGEKQRVYYFDTYNYKFYFYAEDAYGDFWGNKKIWKGNDANQTFYDNGKRYYYREIVIKQEELTYESANDRYVYTLTLTK